MNESRYHKNFTCTCVHITSLSFVLWFRQRQLIFHQAQLNVVNGLFESEIAEKILNFI